MKLLELKGFHSSNLHQELCSSSCKDCNSILIKVIIKIHWTLCNNLCLKSKGITKKNDRFFFEKEIYVDRILEKNKKIFLEIRENVLKLKEKASFYEQSLKQIKNYNDSNYGVNMILAQTQIFLAHQMMKEIEEKDATYFGCKMGEKMEIESCLGVLEKYGKALDERLTQIEIDYENILREVEESYRDLKTVKYRLLSILMHEGSAGNLIV